METTEPTSELKFVWRRLEEAVKLGGHEFEPRVFWLTVLFVVLAVALVYIVLMYVRDSRTIGLWAIPLALLRCCAYGILAVVFLLPARVTWVKVDQLSKVLVAFDVSRSMHTKDDVPTEKVPAADLPTRLDKVVGFFEDEKFVAGLHEKNPITAYRFGGRVDDAAWVIPKGEPLSADLLRDWLYLEEPLPSGLKGEQLADAERNQHELHNRLLGNTNYGESLLRVTNREFTNLAQAIIIFGDGRNTQGSDQTIRDLQARAAKAKIPIITVAVGDARPHIGIEITDLQTPEQARPEDKFPVRIEVDGQGLPNYETTVTLEITSPSGKKFIEKKDFKFDAGGGSPPHAQIEFELKPEEHGVVGDDKKPALEEGKWLFVAKVPRDKREVFEKEFHVSKQEEVQVLKRPLRILLFADAPTRDFQFARTLFVREVDQRRVELSICLQTQRPGLVQDVPVDRLLKHFPNRLGSEGVEKPEERYYNLSQYDLIVAFDPDWTQVSPEQISLLEQWVRLQAGGLVLIAGPIHTNKLARPPEKDQLKQRDQLKQLLDLFPVFLKDSVYLELTSRKKARSQPHRLHFPGATPDMEFLKLDDEGKEPLAGWEEFFTGNVKVEPDRKPVVERGFFSYYPIRGVKPSAAVVATLADPTALLDDGKPQPYLVTMPYGGGKVLYLSSGETFRLRTWKEAYHERFWTKLGRFAGSGTTSRLSRHGVLVMSREFVAGQMVRLEAQLFGRDMQPLSQNATPTLELKLPPGVTMPTKYTLRPKPSAGAEWNGWFQGAFRVTQAGDYRLELQIPETGDILLGKFSVRDLDPELNNPQPDYQFLYRLASPVSEVDGVLDDASQRKLEDTLRATAARLAGVQEDSSGDVVKRRKQVHLFFDLESAHLIPAFIDKDSRPQHKKGQMHDLWDRGMVFTKDELELYSGMVQKVLLALAMLLGFGIAIAWLLDKPLRNLILAAGILLLVQLPLAIVIALAKWQAEWVFPSGLTLEGHLVSVATDNDVRVLVVSYVLIAVVGVLSLEWLLRKLMKLA